MPLRSLAQTVLVVLLLGVAAGHAAAQANPVSIPTGSGCQQVQPTSGDGASPLAQLAAPTGVATWLQGVWLRSLVWVRGEVAATVRVERLRRATTSRASRRVR